MCRSRSEGISRAGRREPRMVHAPKGVLAGRTHHTSTALTVTGEPSRRRMTSDPSRAISVTRPAHPVMPMNPPISPSAIPPVRPSSARTDPAVARAEPATAGR
jgi:hypothetical protein